MATINLSVNSGESKTITFESAGTYNPEDIVFNVTGAAGSTIIAAGASGDTNQLTLAASTKYKLTSAGSTFVFTTPPDHTYNFSGTTFNSGNSSTAEHNANNASKNGSYYYTTNGPATSLGASTDDGALYVQSYSDSWVGQIAQDYRNGRLFVRGKNNGTWSAWKRIANYEEIATSGHNHDSTYLKLSGGTMTGNITMNNGKGIVLTNYTDASSFSDDDRTVPFSLYQVPGTIAYTSSDTNKGLTFNAATGALKAGSFVKRGGTSSQFLKADGSVDSNSYSTTSHNHSGVYKPVQTAVSDPTASGTSTSFIATASQNTNGVITVTKASLPTASSSTAGIMKLGASGGAATYDHNHDTTYKKQQTAVSDPAVSTTAATAFIDTITQNEQGVITATKKSLPTASSSTAGITKVGATGGAAAYGHTHTTSIAASDGTNQITLAFGTKYAITAGGTSYVFTMPSNPDTDIKVKQTAHTTTDTTEYPIITTTVAAPTSGSAYEAKYATQAAVTGSGDIVLKKSSSKCRLKFDNSLNCLDFIFE